MFAEGQAFGGIKIPHRYDRVPPVSADRIDLQRYPPVHERFDQSLALKHNVKVVDEKSEAKPTEQLSYLPVDKACGSKKSCFQDCKPDGCKFIASWVNSRDHVTFDIRAMLPGDNNQWIALAFSKDDKMGDDSVVQCVANDDGIVDVKHSFNDGKNNIKIKQPKLGLLNSSASFVDGVFVCSFQRQRFVPEDERIFDLDQQWTLLFAHGKSKKGIMLPHTMAEIPHVSDNAVDFVRSTPSLITAPSLFIKIHAALMIFGWILCASVASVIGRYFQPYYWGEKMFGSKLWVKVHWLFVLLTTGAVIGGFAIIFVGVDGISLLYENPVSNFNGAHPIMGLVVALLALLNPLLLCLRPSEDSSSRAFFNCLYWIVEIGAHVLAVVTIYAGFGLASFLVPSFFTFLIIGFTVYQILILLFLEALKSYDAKKTIERKKQYLYEMQVRPWAARKNNSIEAYLDLNHTSKALKQTLLAAHLILLSALTTTMVVLIVMNDYEYAL
ncbi:putative ferric-chelate reductase 1 [Dreissena polymorpha]|uniref:putative ferric-chelate reductase 1 n=1 Tax=Dreissena polymorpha TaxID=45954 RepID=UPI0022656926|nr:putative ferric-chelate reductase 1 [Dreissena polymorpha]